MIENKIFNINCAEAKKIKKANSEFYFIAEINGKKIADLKDYLSIITQSFRFPTSVGGLNGYIDWMTDLDWLNANGYILIIQSYNQFMQLDIENKSIVIRLFKENILPWWEEEVEKCVVNGKAKPFNVYLVD